MYVYPCHTGSSFSGAVYPRSLMHPAYLIWCYRYFSPVLCVIIMAANGGYYIGYGHCEIICYQYLCIITSPLLHNVVPHIISCWSPLIEVYHNLSTINQIMYPSVCDNIYIYIYIYTLRSLWISNIITIPFKIANANICKYGHQQTVLLSSGPRRTCIMLISVANLMKIIYFSTLIKL